MDNMVYVVIYHSNAWGDQMTPSVILGVYTSEELANKRAKEFEEKYAWNDDIVQVDYFVLNKKYSHPYYGGCSKDYEEIEDEEDGEA